MSENAFGIAFGQLIQKKRRIEGLTQEALAILAFDDPAKKKQISYLEGGRIANPHQKTIDHLIIALKITDAEIDECKNPYKIDDRTIKRIGPFFRPIDPHQLRLNLNNRYLQFAIDVKNIEDAKKFARIADKEKVDFIEIGDPIFHRYGMSVITEIKSCAPNTPIIAEFYSSDWVEDQIGLASSYGADFVQIIGLSNERRIQRAVASARSHKIGIIISVLSHENVIGLVEIIDSYGADIVAIIRNIDSSNIYNDIIYILDMIPDHIKIPISISGGFTPYQVYKSLDKPWVTVIIGSSILNSPDPAGSIRSIMSRIKS